MEEWLEKFAKVPNPKKVVALLAITALVGVGFYFGFLSDLQRKRKSARSSYNLLLSELQAFEDVARNRVELERRRENLNREMARQESQLPQYAEIYAVLAEVHDYAAASGMELIRFEKKSEATKELYTEIPMTIAVRGTFAQLTDFIDNIRGKGERRVVHVRDLAIGKPETDGSITRVEASFTAVAFQTAKEVIKGQLPAKAGAR